MVRKLIATIKMVCRRSDAEYDVAIRCNDKKLLAYLNKRSANSIFRRAEKKGESKSVRMGGFIEIDVLCTKNRTERK